MTGFGLSSAASKIAKFTVVFVVYNYFGIKCI